MVELPSRPPRAPRLAAIVLLPATIAAIERTSVDGFRIERDGRALYYFGRRGAAAQPTARADVRLTLGAAPGTVVTGVVATF